TGKPILIPDIDAAYVSGQEPDHLEVMRALRLLSVISVPLLARGRTRGVLSFGTAGSGRRYGPADLALAIEVARRTAMAMDNARLHEQTEKAVEQREEVLAIVSHDLRNPLSAILAVTQLLLRAPSGDGGRIDDQTKIKLIRRTAERMDRLIRDLLDMSSIDAGHLSLDVQPVGLGFMIGEMLEILRPSAEGKSLCIDVDVSAHDFQLRCDRARVLRVLLNLVGNAIKFTSPGGSIRISAEQTPASALIKILDTGSGIAADQLTHVFERYWQAHQTASSGTGLGLYISKGIVEAHGGSIWAESTVGKGSAFFFTLPLNVPTPSSPEPSPKA
ncbi:MAG: HAMP domain-containing histidine kinase, partial [Myxococcota bacterium]|nr:HAMP domain-containing histidine kinase [Myxococcota bacterium]